MKERIRAVMEYAGMTQQEFAARLGISPASLSSIFTGRTNPTNNHVMAIHHAFPEINVSWLLFGEGEMLVPASHESVSGPAEENGGRTAEPESSAAMAGTNEPPSLFDSEVLRSPSQSASQPSSPIRQNYEYRREQQRPARASDRPFEMGINIDKKCRKVKEIRVFFDDGTYESFVPSSK